MKISLAKSRKRFLPDSLYFGGCITGALTAAAFVFLSLGAVPNIQARHRRLPTQPANHLPDLASLRPRDVERLPEAPRAPPPQPRTCDRKNALLDEAGNPCRDLSEVAIDQRICAALDRGTRYLTCVPPKNGSSYHKGIIMRILGMEKFYRVGQVHKREEFKERMQLETFSSRQIATFFSDPTMPKYAIVRNPLTRLLSGYLHTMGQHDGKYDPGKTPAERRARFREYVFSRYGENYSSLEERNRTTNPHRRSQMDFCGFRYPDWYSTYRVFRFEEPEVFVDYLYEIVPHYLLDDGWGGKYRNISFREFALEPRLRTHSTEDRFVDYVASLDVFDRLAAAHDADVRFFGYEKDVAELRELVRKAEEKNSNVEDRLF